MKLSGELNRLIAKAHRHWEWGRSQGFRKLIEEDELNPLIRLSNRIRRWHWLRKNGVVPGTAMPVYLVGVQRSGTNMIVHGLQRCPEFEVYNENHHRAFDSFRLRPDETIAEIVASSPHCYVLFKPLIDSHRVDHLLDDLPVATRGRAIWAYRNVDDRVRSAIAKFGDTNLRALTDIASGTGMYRWEAQRLSGENLKLIRSFDYRRMSPASASALFWYVRNSLYFELRLDRRTDVLPVSYDALVDDPEAEMRVVCRFLGFPWQPALVAHMKTRGQASRRRLALEPQIRELCEELQNRLDRARRTAVETMATRAGSG